MHSHYQLTRVFSLSFRLPVWKASTSRSSTSVSTVKTTSWWSRSLARCPPPSKRPRPLTAETSTPPNLKDHPPRQPGPAAAGAGQTHVWTSLHICKYVHISQRCPETSLCSINVLKFKNCFYFLKISFLIWLWSVILPDKNRDTHSARLRIISSVT